MRLAVFGMGYVGCVSSARFAERGHAVVGVDALPAKVEAIAAGRPPVMEPGLGELVRAQVAAGRLRGTGDGAAAVAETDMALICVGTPSRSNGSLSTDALERVAQTIGSAMRVRGGRYAVVVRSTVLPGTADGLVLPLLEKASGLRVCDDFDFAVNPEFLREGTSLADFREPVKTVIGQLDACGGDLVAALYEDWGGTMIRLPLREAEMAKYVDNAFHATKISFANEMGALCRAFGLDSHRVFESFFADTRLNISAAYLRPGFAFGGSCLPKDLRALLHAAKQNDVDVPLLTSVLPSNEACLRRIVDQVVALDRRRIGMFGLSFKNGTDDLRESPFVELSERLLGKGFDLRIYDPQVSLSRLIGSNRAYIQERIPHLAGLLVESAEDVFDHAEVCVVGASHEATVRVLAERNGRAVIDLVRLPDASNLRTREGYVGVAW